MSEPESDHPPAASTPDPVSRTTAAPSLDRTDEQAGEQAGEQSGEQEHPEVQAVLATVEDLDGRPVAEHVGVFEAAHERLRTVLTAPEAGPDSGSVDGSPHV